MDDFTHVDADHDALGFMDDLTHVDADHDALDFMDGLTQSVVNNNSYRRKLFESKSPLLN